MEQVENQNRSWLCLSSFALKIIAIITMTIDHIGFMMQDYMVAPEVGDFFRIIGRFALPLYCFMIVEGVIHTKNIWKYVMRLGVCALAIMVTMIFVEYVPIFNGMSLRGLGNIFLDLMLGALAVYCLKNKNVGIKCLALLPLAFGILSMYADNTECLVCGGQEIWYVPFFLRTQYGYYGILMIILFYVGYILTNYILNGFGKGVYENTLTERIAKNISAILVLLIINTIYYFSVRYFFTNYQGMLDTQMYSILAIVPILLYSGKRGYNAKWFQYSCYAYYALQAIVIFGTFALIFG